MLKIFKIASRVELLAIASVAFTMSACGVFWAGGVDEETNTVAAADPNMDVSGPQEGVASDKEPIKSVDSVITIVNPIETTEPSKTSHDESAIGNLPPAEAVDSDTPTPGVVTPVHSFTGRLNNTNGETLDITVSISGGSVKTQTDASGYFVLRDLPVGIYPMVVSSENSSDVAYLLKNDEKTDLFGPIPSSAISTVSESDLEEPELQTFYYKDDEPSTGNPGPHPEPLPDPYPESSESNGGSTDGYNSSSSRVEYMGHEDPLGSVPSGDMPHESDYGVVKQWTGILNGSTEDDTNKDVKWSAEWTVEVSFTLNSIDKQNEYRKNIFGKHNDESGVFSLAIINGECGTEAPSFALFVSRYGNFSCKDAVISTATVYAGKQITLTGTFDGSTLKLYKDGFEIAENILSFNAIQNLSTEPFVFGDKEIDMTLSDVRLGEKAITSADVLYRYYQ